MPKEIIINTTGTFVHASNMTQGGTRIWLFNAEVNDDVLPIKIDNRYNSYRGAFSFLESTTPDIKFCDAINRTTSEIDITEDIKAAHESGDDYKFIVITTLSTPNTSVKKSVKLVFLIKDYKKNKSWLDATAEVEAFFKRKEADEARSAEFLNNLILD